MQKSAANVDNSNRLMSRLVSALSELLSDSVSNILHTCATLGKLHSSFFFSSFLFECWFVTLGKLRVLVSE